MYRNRTFFSIIFSTESETILIGTGIEITHFFKSNSNSSKAGVPLGVTEDWEKEERGKYADKTWNKLRASDVD